MTCRVIEKIGEDIALDAFGLKQRYDQSLIAIDDVGF